MSAMRRSLLVVSLGLVVAVGASSVCHARDYCIVDNSNSLVYQVLSGFSLPKPGKCKAANGFTVGGIQNTLSGTACTDSGASHLTLNLTRIQRFPINSGSAIQTFSYSFPYPSLTGGFFHEWELTPAGAPYDDGDTSNSPGYKLGPCVGLTPPAP